MQGYNILSCLLLLDGLGPKPVLHEPGVTHKDLPYRRFKTPWIVLAVGTSQLPSCKLSKLVPGYIGCDLVGTFADLLGTCDGAGSAMPHDSNWNAHSFKAMPHVRQPGSRA